jgi:ATP-dependent Lhr-like helicase
MHTLDVALSELVSSGRVIQGEFRPGRSGREFCEADVLRQVRQRSLARVRREVEPVAASTLGRLTVSWHGLEVRRAGLDALLDAVEQLQGAPLIASLLEREILPARIEGYRPGDLDTLAAAGEVMWVGIEPVGERDGRLALYLADHLPKLLPQSVLPSDLTGRARLIVDHLRAAGASFFEVIHAACGGGYPGETVEALWDLAWRGLVTNDAWQALRAFINPPPARKRRQRAPAFRSRRMTPPAAEGRWSLVSPRLDRGVSVTGHAAALVSQLLKRHGILTREALAIENVPGGFGTAYPVLKAMEETGGIRRGYFVAGLGAAQFALPAAVDLLRSLRVEPETPQTVHLAATDPANPYGAILRWPTSSHAALGSPAEPDRRGPTRQAGASVILVNGALAAYLGRADRHLLTFLPDDEPGRSVVAGEVARVLHALATGGSDRPGMLIGEIDGVAAASHALAPFLVDAGFTRRPTGFQAAPP